MQRNAMDNGIMPQLLVRQQPRPAQLEDEPRNCREPVRAPLPAACLPAGRACTTQLVSTQLRSCVDKMGEQLSPPRRAASI